MFFYENIVNQSSLEELRKHNSYKPLLKAICRMTFIVITNWSNFCQYKMR